MEVVKEFDNKLLNRKEVAGVVEGTGVTPTRYEVKSSLAQQFKAKEDLVIVEKINTQYGSADVHVEAVIYNDEKTLKRLTPEHILKRNEGAKPQPVEEETPVAEETPAEEASAEEATEESSEEAPAQAEATEEAPTEEEKKE